MNFQDYSTEDLVCDESFQRYCLGGNEADTAYWESWIASHPEKEAVVLEAKHIISVLSARQGNRLEQLARLKDGMQQYALLKEALSADPGMHTPAADPDQQPAPHSMEPGMPAADPGRVEQPVRRSRVRGMLKYAVVLAAVTILAAAGYLLYTGRSSKAPVQTVYVSGNEPRKTVVLPDGSVIMLRQNSAVELSEGFNQSDRELTLKGEAFFDVTHNTQHPFIVHTTMVDIKVLGTVFNVRARSGTPRLETALFKGKVEVIWKARQDRKVVLSPNQKLVIDSVAEQGPLAGTGRPFKVLPLDADPVDHKAKEIAWVRNRLQIENEPLEAIAAKLEKWYGIPVIFADDEVKSYRYSGTFESETVIKALDALQLSYPFSFKMENGVIVISK